MASSPAVSSLERGRREPSRAINIPDWERWSSVLAGGALALYGLERRDRKGAGIAALGAALALRGWIGYSAFYHSMGFQRFAGAGGAANVIRGRAVHVERSIAVRRPMAEVYEFWRRFENLPLFMDHLLSVTQVAEGIYHWVAKGPGRPVHWDAEIVDEQVPWLITWSSLPGSDVDNAGSVRFSPAPDGGTEVHVSLAYKPPAGVLGAVVARLLGREPGVQVGQALRRFKRILETRSVPTRGTHWSASLYPTPVSVSR